MIDLSIVETVFIVDIQIETCLTEEIIIASRAFVTFAGDRTCSASVTRVTQMNRRFFGLLSTTVTENGIALTLVISSIPRESLPEFLFELFGCAERLSAQRTFDGFLARRYLMIQPYLHAFHMHVVPTTVSREFMVCF